MILSTLVKDIKHKKQQNKKTCTAACISMAYGLTESEIINDMFLYGIDVVENGITCDRVEYYLNMNKQGFEKTYPSNSMGFISEKIVIATALSKRMMGFYHDVLLQIDVQFGITIFDPSLETETYGFSQFNNYTFKSYMILNDYSEFIPANG